MMLKMTSHFRPSSRWWFSIWCGWQGMRLAAAWMVTTVPSSSSSSWTMVSLTSSSTPRRVAGLAAPSLRWAGRSFLASTRTTRPLSSRPKASRVAPLLYVSTTEKDLTDPNSPMDPFGYQEEEENNDDDNNNNSASNTLLRNGQQVANSSSTAGGETALPELGADDGIYHILNREQHAALLAAHPDKLLVLKCFAPWCRACKALEPKFLQIRQDAKYQQLPLIWADLSIQHNKAFVQSLGVLALPTIQFYIGGSLADTFPCGPSKVPILKRKLAALINENVDPATRQLKPSAAHARTALLEEEVAATVSPTTNATDDATATPYSQKQAANASTDTTLADSIKKSVVTGEASSAVVSSKPAVTPAERQAMQRIPYFKELNLADFDVVLDKGRLLTFEPGSILMREGRPGRTFYIIREGEVEICQRTGAEDPLVSASASFLGSVINRLGPGDYFGERALITGEPRAASIRVTEAATCWAFDKDDFPPSSILSGRTKGTAIQSELFDTVNDKYGVTLSGLYQTEVARQMRESATASQKRGSVNNPQIIRGVDTDEEILEAAGKPAEGMVPTEPETEMVSSLTMDKNEAILSVLARFKMIRLVSRCFQYIVQTRAKWGDQGTRKRRSMLVSRLTPAQRDEFEETFHLIDQSGDGAIDLVEMKRVMESIGEAMSDDNLREIMIKAGMSEAKLTLQDFLGIMAEAEFYYLFRDIFASLDVTDSGYVKAGDLDRALCGVRDLISDDRRSIIDVEDQDILIDYEQFSRMLLGTALL